MKRFLVYLLAVAAFLLHAVVVLAFLNAKWNFTPESLDSKLDLVYTRLTGKTVSAPDNTEDREDRSDMIPLSTLSQAAVLEKLDLYVPNNTYLFTEEQAAETYNTAQGAVVAAHVNEDATFTNIIITPHGAMSAQTSLVAIRDQVVTQLQEASSDLLLESSSVIWREEISVPVITTLQEEEEILVVSCIAFFGVEGSVYTVTIHHYGSIEDDVCTSAFQMFNQTLYNII